MTDSARLVPNDLSGVYVRNDRVPNLEFVEPCLITTRKKYHVSVACIIAIIGKRPPEVRGSLASSPLRRP